MDNSILSFTTNRRQPVNHVCESVSIDLLGQSATAKLVVNRSHPFFFDHELDHMPGLLILEGMCQISEILVKNLNLNSGFHINDIHVDFIKFCMFSRHVGLSAKIESIQENKIIVHVASTQSKEKHCLAAVIYDSNDTESFDKSASDNDFSDTISPCPKECIRKSSSDNVMITVPQNRSGSLYTKILKPSEKNPLSDHTQGLYHPLYILEAFMQVQRYLNHFEVKTNENKRIRDILISTDISLVRQVKQSESLFLVIPKQHLDKECKSVSERERYATIFSDKSVKLGTCSIKTRCFSRPSATTVHLNQQVSSTR